MTHSIRLLLADDHAAIRAQLPALLDAQPDIEVVGVVADGRAAVQAALTLMPDIVVMDLSMPVMSGLEATAELHALCPEIPVVALTAHEERAYVAAMQGAGGRGYVLKQSPVEVLFTAVRVVVAGEAFLDPILDSVAPPPPAEAPAIPAPAPDVLTERERVILQHTACGLTTREIAAALGVDIAEVGATRTRAMARLGLPGRVALTRYAERHGWLSTAPPQRPEP